jgi:histidine triad (HIT) family protein
MAQENSCIFCRILAGQVEASMVFRDASVSAFMDIRPVNTGHVLVIPNDHSSDLAGLPPTTGGHLFAVAQRLAAALRRSEIRCEGVNLYLADGRAAGQEVFHVHLHVVPRFPGDGFGLRRSMGRGQPEREALDRTAEQIRAGFDA